MTHKESSPPVLVVGAGLAGLVAALTLVKNGIRVRIIEKNVEHRRGQRGAGIAPRTCEVFHFLEVPEIEQRMSPMPLLQTYRDGGIEPMETTSMFPPSQPHPSRPYGDYMCLGQHTTEGILRGHLARYGITIELGTELRTLRQYGERIEVQLEKRNGEEQVEETTSVDWLIGADGAKGVVRKCLDVTFLGETRNESAMLVGDLRIKGLDADRWHMWGTMRSNFVGLRAAPDLGPSGFVLFASGKGMDGKKLSTDLPALFEWMRSVMERSDLAIEEVYWVSEFRPNIRMASAFSQGRVFIVGDAAHVHSPTGGQGANSSIQDSFNLAWKLALVIKGFSPASLLSSYSEERIPVIAEMLNLTTRFLDKNIEADKQAQAKSWRRGEETYMLAINYRGSRILVDEFAGGTKAANPYGDLNEETLRAGDRAPDAPGLSVVSGPDTTVTRLFDIFKPIHHTILVFTHEDSYASSIVSAVKELPTSVVRTIVLHPPDLVVPSTAKGVGADFELMDTEGWAAQFYGLGERSSSRTIVVRPDGVIGAVVEGLEGLRKYFDLILC
ncbi:FAD binding domain-containing protein [Phlebopus sp. FC_14]|nr:FAD binding domain-containing protein [Phlebopus sp. FC_14]